MATSLARQLKNLQKPETSKFVQKRGKYSFLYDYFDAASVDCNTHYALAISGLEELVALDPSVSRYKKSFLDPSAKSFDRGMRSSEENEQLDAETRRFLFHVVTPYFLLASTHKVIEWLIYKFEINLYNTDALILSALPYHETRLFSRLLQAMPSFKDESIKWNFLYAAQKNCLPILKSVLINRCLQEDWLSSLLIESLPEIISSNPRNGNFVTLTLGIILGCLSRSQDESLLSTVVNFIITGLSSDYPSLVAASYTALALLSCKCEISLPVLQSILKKAGRKFKKYPFRDEIKDEYGLMTATVIENQSLERVKQLNVPTNALHAVLELDLPTSCWSEKGNLVKNVIHLLLMQESPEALDRLTSFVSSLPCGLIDSKVTSLVVKRLTGRIDTPEVQCRLLKLILILGDSSSKSHKSLMKKLTPSTLDASAAVTLIDELTLVKNDDPCQVEKRIELDLTNEEWHRVMILLEIFATAPSFESPTSLLVLSQQLLKESLLADTPCEYYRSLLIDVMIKCVKLDADINLLEVDAVIESFKFFFKPRGFHTALSLLTMVSGQKRLDIMNNVNILLVNLACKPELLEKAITSLIPRLVSNQSPSSSSSSSSPSKSVRASGLDSFAESLVDAFVDSIFEVAPHLRLSMLQLLLKKLPDRSFDYAISVLGSETINGRLSKLGDAGERMVLGRKQLASDLLALKSK